jgi:hypothetical protein
MTGRVVPSTDIRRLKYCPARKSTGDDEVKVADISVHLLGAIESGAADHGRLNRA